MPWEEAIWGRDGMLWARTYSNPPGEDLIPSVVKELEVNPNPNPNLDGCSVTPNNNAIIMRHSILVYLLLFQAILERLGASRMVVGHTPQPHHGINR